MKKKIKKIFQLPYLGMFLAQDSVNSRLFQLIGDKFGSGTQGTPAGSTTAGELIIIIVQILLLVAGSIAVIYLMIGGFQYVTSRGNEEQSESAKKTLQSAILGLVIIVMSFVIISIISRILLEGTGGVGIP